MANTLKVLGQSIPAAATLTALYTVPAATSVTVSTITACNQSTDTPIRISVAVAGAVDTPAQYLYFDINVPANETLAATLGITLAATDVVRVQSGNGLVSFNAFGVQVT